MNIVEFVGKYPELYHMAEKDSWTSIRKFGLLSVTAILDLFAYDGARRERIESQWRPEKITVRDPVKGSIVIRDQKPMPPDALAPCLIGGIQPSDWYKLLNGRSFFWVSRDRLERMLTAKAYVNQRNTVITVRTKPLLERYVNKVALTAFNTGFAFDHRPRGLSSFKKLEEWPFGYSVAEFAVEYAVPELAEYVTSVEEWKGAWRSGERACERVALIWPT